MRQLYEGVPRDANHVGGTLEGQALLDDDRGLAAKLKGDRNKVGAGGLHHGLPDRRQPLFFVASSKLTEDFSCTGQWGLSSITPQTRNNRPRIIRSACRRW